jgi:hypothetical protein
MGQASSLSSLPPARFGQRSLPARLLTQSMEFLDENKVRELIVTDTLLMVIPRTTIEGMFRDAQARWDAIREVLMREILSTVAMVFVMPFIGNGVSKAFDRLPALNKKGLFTGAWINDYVLKRAMQHYEATLSDMVKTHGKDALDPAAVRQNVIQRLLNDVETGDQTLLNGLSRVLKDVPGDVSKQLLPNKTGAVQDLTRLFQVNRAKPQQGIFPVDDTVKRLMAAQKQLGHPGQLETNAQRAALFNLRLAESVKDFNSGKPWMKAVDAVLSHHQFGDRLSFEIREGSRKVLNRQELMMSLRHFVQQIVDRSLVTVTDKSGKASADKLRAVADDLVTHTHGSKNWITWLPFFIALVGGRSVPAIINGLSRLMHGGKQYFPGDVALVNDVATKPVKPLPSKLLTYRENNQVFAGFAAGGNHG